MARSAERLKLVNVGKDEARLDRNRYPNRLNAAVDKVEPQSSGEPLRRESGSPRAEEIPGREISNPRAAGRPRIIRKEIAPDVRVAVSKTIPRHQVAVKKGLPESNADARSAMNAGNAKKSVVHKSNNGLLLPRPVEAAA